VLYLCAYGTDLYINVIFGLAFSMFLDSLFSVQYSRVLLKSTRLYCCIVPNLTFITVSRPGGSPEHREETQGRFVGASK